jgi:hypothetical protein
MWNRSLTTTKVLLASALLSLASCTPEGTASGLSAEEEALGLGGLGRRDWRVTELNVSSVMDAEGIGEAGSERTGIAILNDAEYEALFGHSAPDDVDFDSEIVLFFSAGVQPTGGYVASIAKVLQLGNTLKVVTQLSVPGESCATTDALTTPYALVTVSPINKVQRVRFQHLRSVDDCEPPTCDDVMCAQGQHCELQEIVCITTPCNPIPTCVDDTVEPDAGTDPDPDPPFCGGFGGFPCPGAGECVDDPNDGCDPTMGGADCGGLCQCNSIGSCIEGFAWDESPEVCACVAVEENPCNLVDCLPNMTCEVQGGEAVCVPIDVEPNPCAFTLCMVGTECIVQDGEAVCVPFNAGGEQCGDVTCPTGEICCNESCGICTPPDGACIDLFCEPKR